MDWIGAVLNVTGLFLLANHRLKAMYVYLLSSVAFLIWGTLNEIWAIVALQAVLLVLNIRVIVKWRNNNGTT